MAKLVCLDSVPCSTSLGNFGRQGQSSAVLFQVERPSFHNRKATEIMQYNIATADSALGSIQSKQSTPEAAEVDLRWSPPFICAEFGVIK
jgi:hypothetical protein